jgi:hypothetical protein
MSTSNARKNWRVWLADTEGSTIASNVVLLIESKGFFTTFSYDGLYNIKRNEPVFTVSKINVNIFVITFCI